MGRKRETVLCKNRKKHDWLQKEQIDLMKDIHKKTKYMADLERLLKEIQHSELCRKKDLCVPLISRAQSKTISDTGMSTSPKCLFSGSPLQMLSTASSIKPTQTNGCPSKSLVSHSNHNIDNDRIYNDKNSGFFSNTFQKPSSSTPGVPSPRLYPATRTCYSRTTSSPRPSRSTSSPILRGNQFLRSTHPYKLVGDSSSSCLQSNPSVFQNNHHIKEKEQTGRTAGSVETFEANTPPYAQQYLPLESLGTIHDWLSAAGDEGPLFPSDQESVEQIEKDLILTSLTFSSLVQQSHQEASNNRSETAGDPVIPISFSSPTSIPHPSQLHSSQTTQLFADEHGSMWASHLASTSSTDRQQSHPDTLNERFEPEAEMVCSGGDFPKVYKPDSQIWLQRANIPWPPSVHANLKAPIVPEATKMGLPFFQWRESLGNELGISGGAPSVGCARGKPMAVLQQECVHCEEAKDNLDSMSEELSSLEDPLED